MQALAKDVLGQGKSLCAADVAKDSDLNTLQAILDTLMPPASAKTIDYKRTDNICKGAVTEDDSLVPQDLADVFNVEGTLSSPGSDGVPSGSLKPRPPPAAAQGVCKDKKGHNVADSKPDIGSSSEGASGMKKERGAGAFAKSGRHAKAGNGQASLRAQLQEKLAELERLKQLKLQQEQAEAIESAVSEGGGCEEASRDFLLQQPHCEAVQPRNCERSETKAVRERRSNAPAFKRQPQQPASQIQQKVSDFQEKLVNGLKEGFATFLGCHAVTPQQTSSLQESSSRPPARGIPMRPQTAAVEVTAQLAQEPKAAQLPAAPGILQWEPNEETPAPGRTYAAVACGSPYSPPGIAQAR